MGNMNFTYEWILRHPKPYYVFNDNLNAYMIKRPYNAIWPVCLKLYPFLELMLYSRCILYAILRNILIIHGYLRSKTLRRTNMEITSKFKAQFLFAYSTSCIITFAKVYVDITVYVFMFTSCLISSGPKRLQIKDDLCIYTRYLYLHSNFCDYEFLIGKLVFLSMNTL